MNSPQLLANGVKELNIQVDEKQLELLWQYVQLLQKWNQTYNLTAIEDTNEIISKHIFDSLSVVKYLKGKNIIDVGSGAGLPGIPLAVVCRDKQFTLLDSKAKKTRFIQQAIIDLRLKNAQVIRLRTEDYSSDEQVRKEFSTIVSRAFVSSDKLFTICSPLLKHLDSNGYIIFMLGKQKHLEVLPKSYTIMGIHSIKIPHLEAQRHIAIVKKRAHKI